MIERSSFVFLPPGSVTAPDKFQIESTSERRARVDLEVSSRVLYSVNKREADEIGYGPDESVNMAWGELLDDHLDDLDEVGEEASKSFITKQFGRKGAVARAVRQGFVEAEAAAWYGEYSRRVAPHRGDVLGVDVESAWQQIYKENFGMEFDKENYTTSSTSPHASPSIAYAHISAVKEILLKEAPIRAVGPFSYWEEANNYAESEWRKHGLRFDSKFELEPGRLPGTAHWSDHDTTASRIRKSSSLLSIAAVAASLSADVDPHSATLPLSGRPEGSRFAPGSGRSVQKR
ncbi:hypothetical protein ACH4C6_34420 [Streptomyces sp. NPDC017943]|uniref:hypothetical protein n=1 Tax=Streptomyces sp. NPDC017943 TaxID=3365019 RepID=UPI0037A123B2